MRRLMIIEDDASVRSMLTEFFVEQGYRVDSFSQAPKALAVLTQRQDDFDVVLSDINMPEMDGLAFVQRAQLLSPDLPVILMTAFGSVETAVKAIRVGAYDYVIKPFKLAEMELTLQRALEYRKLQKDNRVLRRRVQAPWSFGKIIGKSPGMRNLIELVKRVSATRANVLITGESGTGKEVIAKAIHENGPRKKKPFVAVNCSAIPESLLESELFGHSRGAFTGAIQKKVGLFEEAQGGTLFLDEIGDMTPALQAKLLRVLQERKIRPVGENRAKEIDVRIISATHRNLKKSMEKDDFREDLFYRLEVIPVQIPPLRERPEDIPLLAEHFLAHYAAMNDVHVTSISPAAMKHLVNRAWPGNVRELENAIERAVVLCRGSVVELSDLPAAGVAPRESFFSDATSDYPTLDELERRYIAHVLRYTHGRKGQAANILGINRRTLHRKELLYPFDESLGGKMSHHAGATSVSPPLG